MNAKDLPGSRQSDDQFSLLVAGVFPRAFTDGASALLASYDDEPTAEPTRDGCDDAVATPPAPVRVTAERDGRLS